MVEQVVNGGFFILRDLDRTAPKFAGTVTLHDSARPFVKVEITYDLRPPM